MTRPTADIARHTATYGVGFVIGGIARLVLVPVIARTLSADEYGVYSLLLAAVYFLQIAFDLGFAQAMIRFHHDRPDPEEQRRLRPLIFTVLPVLDLVILAPLLLAREGISQLMFGTGEHAALVGLAVLIAFFATQLDVFIGHLRSQDRSRAFVVLMAARGTVALTTTLVLVFGLKMGITGFLLGQLAAPLVVSVLAVPRLVGKLGWDLRDLRARLAPLLRFGLPLMPAALGIWGLSYLDSYLLRGLADLESVGVYRFAAELCLPLSLLLTSFLMAWPSFAFARAREPGGPEALAQAFRHLMIVLIWASLGLSALRTEILEVLGADTFAASGDLVPLWTLATCVFGAAQVFGVGLQIARNTTRLPLLVLVAILLNVGLAFVVIPRYGVVGAATAKIVTLTVLSALVLRESDRHFPISYPIGRALAAVVAAALVLLLTDSYGDLPLAVGIAARTATVLLFPLALLVVRAISLDEMRALPQLARELVGGLKTRTSGAD